MEVVDFVFLTRRTIVVIYFLDATAFKLHLRFIQLRGLVRNVYVDHIYLDWVVA